MISPAWCGTHPCSTEFFSGIRSFHIIVRTSTGVLYFFSQLKLSELVPLVQLVRSRVGETARSSNWGVHWTPHFHAYCTGADTFTWPHLLSRETGKYTHSARGFLKAVFLRLKGRTDFRGELTAGYTYYFICLSYWISQNILNNAE